MTWPRLRLGRNVDEGAGHQLYSRQAAMVTITSTVSDHSEPSLISAMATTFCESASRMRVENGGLAGARTEMNRDDVRLRVLLVEDVDRLDVIRLGHRAVDRDRHRDGVAVLHQRRNVEGDLALAHRRLADHRGGSRPSSSRALPSARRDHDGTRLRAPSRRLLQPVRRAGWGEIRVLSVIDSSSIAQRREERHNVLDLLRRQHRLAAKRRRNPLKSIHADNRAA